MTDLGSEPERPRRDDGLARYGALGLQFAASVGLLAWGGHWLDGRLGTTPWFLITGAFLGFAGGFLAIVRAVPPPKGGGGSAGRRPR
jgi:F0F1-type ATP synthase assembly protein I